MNYLTAWDGISCTTKIIMIEYTVIVLLATMIILLLSRIRQMNINMMHLENELSRKVNLHFNKQMDFIQDPFKNKISTEELDSLNVRKFTNKILDKDDLEKMKKDAIQSAKNMRAHSHYWEQNY